jgi:hypothetical protein
MPAPALILDRVRLHGRPADAISARWWLERALDGTGHAAGLAPGVILIVRRLYHIPPASGSGQRWSEWLDHRLAGLARGAARPASEPVPASCEAVLFADEAELLACLARDWLEGRVADRWWWSLRRGDPTEFLTAQWTNLARHVPAAIDALAAERLHVPFARRLDQREVLAITRAIAGAWGAGWLGGLDGAMTAARVSDTEQPRHDAVSRAGRRASASRAGTGAGAPWSVVAPELEAERLSPDRELMIGFSLLLRHAPALALASPTAAQIRAWLERSVARAAEDDRRAALIARSSALTGSADEYTVGAATPGVDSLSMVSPVRLSSGPLRAVDAGPAMTVEPPNEGAAATSGRPATRFANRTARSGATPEPLSPLLAGPSVSVRPGAWHPELADSSVARPVCDGPDVRPSLRSRSGMATDEMRPPPPVFAASEHPEMITTEIGGILLLLNVAIHLGHYGDFTSPRQAGIALSPWDWLALIGRYLLPRQAGRDPVWRLLAELAGRDERTPPGGGFRPPPAWRLPPSWLALPHRASARWSWVLHQDRLIVRHPLGFVVLDLPAHADPIRQLERELARYRRVVGTIVICPGSPPRYPASSHRLPPALVRWRSSVGSYVAVRLRLALGASSRRQASTQALCRRARIRRAHERLDAWFSLDELPVSIRVAGLDRDPGWIPATGLTIAFYYD